MVGGEQKLTRRVWRAKAGALKLAPLAGLLRVTVGGLLTGGGLAPVFLINTNDPKRGKVLAPSAALQPKGNTTLWAVALILIVMELPL